MSTPVLLLCEESEATREVKALIRQWAEDYPLRESLMELARRREEEFLYGGAFLSIRMLRPVFVRASTNVIHEQPDTRLPG